MNNEKDMKSSWIKLEPGPITYIFYHKEDKQPICLECKLDDLVKVNKCPVNYENGSGYTDLCEYFEVKGNENKK